MTQSIQLYETRIYALKQINYNLFIANLFFRIFSGAVAYYISFRNGLPGQLFFIFRVDTDKAFN